MLTKCYNNAYGLVIIITLVITFLVACHRINNDSILYSNRRTQSHLMVA